MKSGKVSGLPSFPQMPLAKSDTNTHMRFFTIVGVLILEFSVGFESKSNWHVLKGE